MGLHTQSHRLLSSMSSKLEACAVTQLNKLEDDDNIIAMVETDWKVLSQFVA